jgi:Secretion system C-terminal sorting domain
MKKNYKLAFMLLTLCCISSQMYSQAPLIARSKYEYNNANIATLADSTLFYFSGNHYQPFISRLQTDWDSIRADSIVQTEKLGGSFYLYKIDKEFNANHQMIMRGDFSRTSNAGAWIKETKFINGYDTVGNIVDQTLYTGSGSFFNVWNPKNRTKKSFENILPASSTDGLRPTYYRRADYNFTTTNWDTKDSSTYGYNAPYNITYGTQYRDNGNGLVYTNFLTGTCAPPYTLTTNYNNRVNLSLNSDSFLKTEIYFMGIDKDSIVEYEYDNTDSIWRIQRANYYEFYPGALKTYTWRNYVFSLNTPTNLIYAQGNFTEFGTILGAIDYRYPTHRIDGDGAYKLENWITYRYPYTKPIPIQIITNGFDAFGNVSYIKTDSFFYDGTDKIILIKTKTASVNSYIYYTKTDFAYTSDGQLQTEKMSYYDSTANAYVFKSGAYIYTFYYGNQANTIHDENTLASDINVYPNPTKHTLQIHSNVIDDNTTFIIYDMMGKQMMQCKRKNSGGKQEEIIDMHHLPSGIFMLEIIGNHTKNTVVFIKE